MPIANGFVAVYWLGLKTEGVVGLKVAFYAAQAGRAIGWFIIST